jgi:Fe2+ or Zn2+ uptake regulation protein
VPVAADPSVVADLRQVKLPANRTRVRILTRMRALDRPVTPDALCQQLEGDLGRVSVYRTLAELARADLVSSFRLPGGKIVYSAGRAQPALRLTCPRCGHSATAPEPSLGPALIAAMTALGYSDQDVLILATCHRCTA